MGGWDDRSSWNVRPLDALYVAVRDSATVDRQVAFDIVMNELEYARCTLEARELAEASVGDDDETRWRQRLKRRSWTPTDMSRAAFAEVFRCRLAAVRHPRLH